MSSGYHDLCIDLINKSKETKETQKKLFYLEQVKEIIFHRDEGILSEILQDVLELMLERSIVVRKFLISLAADAIEKNINTTPTVLSMYSHLITENNDSLLRNIAYEVSRLYGKLVIYIVGLPQKTKAQIASGHIDPKSLWTDLRNLTKKLEDTVSSDRSDDTRINCIKFLEGMALFGLPLPPLSSDPRLARSQKAAQSNKDNASHASMIPLTHPFISRDELEQEAESVFSKFLLWANKAGALNFSFTSSIISQLGQSIAAVAISRPKKVPNASTALTFILQSKGNVCSQMTPYYRDELNRSAQRLLRIATSHFGSDTDGMIAKLKHAVASLSALGTIDEGSSNVAVDVNATRKRLLGNEDGDVMTDDAALQLRASVLQAVDALSNDIKPKASKTTDANASSSTASSTIGITNINDSSSSVAASTSFSFISPTAVAAPSTDTELAQELEEFVEISSMLSLAHLPVGHVSSAYAASNTSLKLIPPPDGTYDDLAINALHKVLDGFEDVKIYGAQAIASHAIVAIRMVVSMSLNDIAMNKNWAKVVLISSFSSSIGTSGLIDLVPLEITLPRPMWLFLSYMIASYTDEFNKIYRTRSVRNSQTAVTNEHSDMIVKLLNELLKRRTVEDMENDTCNSIYELICLALLSRTLQSVHLRPMAKRIFSNIHVIPLSILKFLKLLTLTGSKVITAASVPVRKGMDALKDRGIRTEARTLLSQFVTMDIGEDAAIYALNILLWCTVSDDFETRDKTVKELIGKTTIASAWAYEATALFAIQSAISVIGVDVVKDRVAFMATIVDKLYEEDVDVSDAAATATATADADAMDVEASEGDANAATVAATAVADGGNDIEVVDDAGHLTIADAVARYDDGRYFDGSFSTASNTTDTAVAATALDLKVRKSFHLLLQMCVAHPPFLKTLMDIYGTAVYGAEAESAKVASVAATNDTANSTSADIATTATAATTTAVVTQEDNRWSSICAVLQAELVIIIPVLSKRHNLEDIFKILAHGDPLARPLLEHALGLLLGDLHTPATSKLIIAVKSYIRRFCDNAVDRDNIKLDTSIEGIDIDANVNLIIPLLGGLPLNAVEVLVPKLATLFSSTKPDVLKSAYNRIIHARPPPMNRVTLLTYLHHVEGDAKQLAAAIGICLKYGEEFKSDTIKQTLSDLSTMEPIHNSQLLMRTAILSSKSYLDVRKHVLSAIIPTLIRRKVWECAPGIWKGITTFFSSQIWERVSTVFAAGSNYIKEAKDVKDAEVTLRCILGLPTAQLKQILKDAGPNVRVMMVQILQVLSTSEREDVTSGKWAGLDNAVDPDKAKVIKELTTATAAVKAK